MSKTTMELWKERQRRFLEAMELNSDSNEVRLMDAIDALADWCLEAPLILCAGNGGGATLAAHLTSELIGGFGPKPGGTERRIPALPAVNLSGDAAVLTGLVNDYGFPACIRRQADALHDALPAPTGASIVTIIFTTSGRSSNLQPFNFSGRKAVFCGSAGQADGFLAVPSFSDDPQTTQEIHLMYIHLLVEAILERQGR